MAGNQKSSSHEESNLHDQASFFINKEAPFGMTDYFRQDILPLNVSGSTKTVEKSTPNVQSDSILLLLFTEGAGTIYINQSKMAVHRGTLICMGPFQNYRIVPKKGEPLTCYRAKMNSGAYMYLLSCPYLKLTEFTIPATPAFCHLTGTKYTMAVEAMETILKPTDNPYYRNKISFFCVMELYGLLLNEFVIPEGGALSREGGVISKENNSRNL